MQAAVCDLNSPSTVRCASIRQNAVNPKAIALKFATEKHQERSLVPEFGF
ncbi:MAG: hypothetical protein AAFX40_12625 [Cyanobacteria bacterium J06639_1]